MAKSFGSIKKQLSTQYYFMNDAWLKDCLDYFLSEHPDADEAEILSLIINQWLLCDLREINNDRGSLPRDIQQQKFITLPGNYMLQIEKAYDISTPKYKQLEKLRKVSNENIEVTEAETNQPIESKNKRMMNLYLSDGVQNVMAMEYKPISSLDKIVPGYKILIKGPVACRRGVIMLEDKNISMIGGEIESLLIENAPENVLARALNLPENPDPYMNVVKADDSLQDLSDDNMDIDLDAVARIEKLNETMQTLSTDNSSNKRPNKSDINTIEKKRGSIMCNELPVCFKQQTQNMSAVVDDTDDEWIGMIDENNLDMIAQPTHTRHSNRSSQNFDSDSEFCEFEMHNDIIKYDNNSLCKDSSKPTNIQVFTNAFELTSNKPIAKSPIIATTHKSDASTMKTSKIGTPSMNMSNLHSSFAHSPNVATKQQLRKPKGINTKITDFIKKTDPKDNKRSLTTIRTHDLICDVKKIIPTRELTYKTIRATPKTLQKLTKKETDWYLEGSVGDGTDYLDVTFSPEVLGKLIGFSFNEFSQRKKLQRTNPKIKDELRLILRNTESVLTKMDALLKLELRPNEIKAKIICITQLTDEERLQR